MTRKGWLFVALGAAVGLAILRRKDVMSSLGYITSKLASRSNYGERRDAAKVDTIVLHTTEGAFNGAVAWFQNPAAKVSAHYLVARDGRVVLAVPEEYVAFHAGNTNVNNRSIGIELEDTTPGAAGSFPPAMMDSLVRLTRALVATYGISARRGLPGIAAHSDVPRDPAKGMKTDPGPDFPWSSYLARVNGKDAIA